MFVISIHNKCMSCSDGSIYYFPTSKEAAYIVDICYGLSAFKRGICKIQKVKRQSRLLPVKIN
jgi:hypothetical protein